MTNRAPEQAPLRIDRVQRAPVNADRVRLTLAGSWLDQAGAAEEELLVVQLQGRRHRFTASRESAPGGDPARWSASFTLPLWAEPRYEGQAALWLGNSVIAVPPAGTTPEPAAEARGPIAVETPLPPAPPAPPFPPGTTPEAAAEVRGPIAVETPAPPAAPGPPAAAVEPTPAVVSVPAETPRSGPLADMLLKETVAALHAELEQRTADAARVRGALADAQSELEARTAMQATLETAHGQLRAELDRLTTAVAHQRSEQAERMAELERERGELRRQLADLGAARAEAVRLRQDLAAATVARDAAVGEVAGLRTELGRMGSELSATRERVGAEGGDLGEAQRLLADAKALAEQLREDRARD